MSVIPSTQSADYSSLYLQLEKNSVEDYTQEANQANQETKQMEDKAWQPFVET